jgi:hypothetical protein
MLDTKNPILRTVGFGSRTNGDSKWSLSAIACWLAHRASTLGLVHLSKEKAPDEAFT